MPEQYQAVGAGALEHENAKKFLPTGGWWFAWIGDPDQGSGRNQPGGWIYCLLPYIEQPTLAQLGAGLQSQSAAKNAFGTQLATTPLPALYCPSRRSVQTYQYNYQSSPQYALNWNNASTSAVARSDYAANAGDNGTNDGGAWAPTTIAQGLTGPFPDTSQVTGIGFYRSEVSVAAVKDGASNTYLFGEKYLNPDSYTTGIDYADNENCYVGVDNDTLRISASTTVSGASTTVNTYYPPLLDTPGNATTFPFGSAHPGTFNISFCDGSVHAISYAIDPETHRRLSNRLDGQVLDTSKF